jgi:hypothetical protein
MKKFKKKILIVNQEENHEENHEVNHEENEEENNLRRKS